MIECGKSNTFHVFLYLCKQITKLMHTFFIKIYHSGLLIRLIIFIFSIVSFFNSQIQTSVPLREISHIYHEKIELQNTSNYIKKRNFDFFFKRFFVHLSFTTVLLFECKNLKHKIIQKVKLVNCLELCP